ncbi:beta family protein [Methyloraptor flagellatus]|uniref:Beta family protein n=1 Tax=Methyloraptor flagellatus TaxID=3162530 RepID=A0AAU7X7P0_9HYPH
MFNHLHYVPILKWKLGEYQALARLESSVKDRVTPLIELPAVGYDFENSRVAKSLDDHLKDFGRRLKAKWASRTCFVDTKNIASSERMADGTHPLERVMQLARTEGCTAIPVVALSCDAEYRRSAAVAVLADGNGAAIRLQLEDFDRQNIDRDIELLLSDIGASVAGSDLIVDLCDKFLPTSVFVEAIISSLQKLPHLNRWRTFTIAGSSYPKTLQDVAFTIHKTEGTDTPVLYPDTLYPRREWAIYKTIVNTLGRKARLPAYGDYVVAHPDPVELDMRLIKPFAKLRYTTSDSWYIIKGKPVRTYGFDQYKDMCKQTTKKERIFEKSLPSDGDRYIQGCADGDESTGNMTTWVWVSSNRHITRVVADLSTFHGA